MKTFLMTSAAVLAFSPGAATAQVAIASVSTAAPGGAAGGSAPDGQTTPVQATGSGIDSDQAHPSAGDIIVTAQRREERLQDVPVAISAYNAQKRDDLGIETVQDVAKFTPSVSFSEFPNRFFIRGIGRYTNQLGSDPGVATYVDGFYTSETTAIGSSPILIDRIEVLRGPQGTLYGRNSIGGAVNVISNMPTDTLTGQVRIDAGNYMALGGAASVSGPITDWLRFRVTGEAYDQNKGYLQNDGASGNYDRTRFQLLEGQLAADFGSRVTAWVKYQYFNSNGQATLNTQIDPYDTTDFITSSDLVPNPTYGYSVPNPGTTNLFHSSLNYVGAERIHNANQIIGHINIDLGGATLKYIGGYQSFDYSRSIDYDLSDRASYNYMGTTISSNLINNITDNKRFYSHELDLASNSSGPFKYIAGLYYYHEVEDQTYTLLSPDQPELGYVLEPPTYASGVVNPSRQFLNLTARQIAKSYAAFGQIDYTVAPHVTLTAGLRYSRDDKDGFEGRTYYYFNPNVVQGYALDVTPALRSEELKNHWDGLTGKAGIAWQPDQDTNIYANYSRGYKSGGFNLYSFVSPVGKETLNSYEIGLKKSLPAHLRVDLGAYYYDYHNIQIPVNFVQPGSGLVLVNFINAPRARSYGFEAETTWAPTKSFEALVSYSYLNAEFRNFCCYVDVANPAGGAQDLRGSRIPQSPRNKVTGTVLNKFDLGGGTTIAPVATVNYTSKQYYAPFTTAKYEQPGYVRADFRLELHTANGLQVNGYVNNAFNEKSFNGFQLGAAETGFARQVTINLPRTYGVELIAKF